MMRQKRVIVTGGSRGIGKAIADTLVRRRYDVTIVARDEQCLRRCVSVLSGKGKIRYEVLDLLDRQAIERFAAQWRKKHLYALINNAGMWGEERIDEVDTGLYQRIMRLNLDGPFCLTNELVSSLVDGGRIVNISSQLGISGRAAFGAYAASKHGLIGLTRCWAYELGPRGITVNAVCPGWVDTESNRAEIRPWAKERGMSVPALMREISAPYPSQRFVEEAEVGELVAFLVSPEGSGVNGKVLEIT